jgi:hypothetical protein
MGPAAGGTLGSLSRRQIIRLSSKYRRERRKSSGLPRLCLPGARIGHQGFKVRHPHTAYPHRPARLFGHWILPEEIYSTSVFRLTPSFRVSTKVFEARSWSSSPSERSLPVTERMYRQAPRAGGSMTWPSRMALPACLKASERQHSASIRKHNVGLLRTIL